MIKKEEKIIYAIFVNLKHKDIVTKVVNDNAYILIPEEIITARADMFTNDSIYRYVDMSGMSGNISQLTKEEFSLLGKKLTCITNIDSIAIHNAVPRMRFSQFNSVNDFVLASDYSCISPVDGFTSREIHEGLVIGVKDNTVSVDLSDGGGIMLYPIQYGVM